MPGALRLHISRRLPSFHIFMREVKNVKQFLHDHRAMVMDGEYMPAALNFSGMFLATSMCDGRLGNLMFTMGTLYAYEQEFGVVPVLSMHTHRRLCYYFECQEKVLILQKLSNWKNITWKYFDPDDKRCLNGQSSAPNSALGHFLDIGIYPEKINYIKKYLPQLRQKYFKLKEVFQKCAQRKIDNAKKLYLNTHNIATNRTIQYIGIHCRRTDYAEHLSRQNLTLVGKDYFSRAMNIFRTSEMNPLFIITSDDMNWAMENIEPFENDCFFLGTGMQNSSSRFISGISEEIGVDLALLAQMNYTIMTYGSFGMWGALLSDSKKVILPRGYETTDTIWSIRAANISGWTFI